ncbi:hypothetical protein SDC9_118943 [bioreactor metagenome]|uniref:Uncharacterized protein n=1 Tax=bioreactor metagenome TaxID=1076179 RepID=A0A645C4S5_9ZZZZ
MRFHRHGAELGVGLPEGFERGFLSVEGLHDIMPAVHFLNMTVELTHMLLLRRKINLGLFYDSHHNARRKRQYEQCNQRHQHVDGEHHSEHAEYHGSGGDKLRQALTERLIDHIDVVGDVAEHLAVGFAVVIFQRQPVHLLRDGTAQVKGNVVGHPCHDEPLQEGAQCGQQVEPDQPGDNPAHIGKIGIQSCAGGIGEQALNQFGRHLAQQFRTDDRKHGGDDRNQNDR